MTKGRIGHFCHTYRIAFSEYTLKSYLLIYSITKGYILAYNNIITYKLKDVILHSDRGGMYKSGIYNTKTAEMNLIPSMSAPYTCTHNPWIETLNGQFKDFIKRDNPKTLNELQIALNKFVYYNNNIKIKNKLKTTPINYRCSHV